MKRRDKKYYEDNFKCTEDLVNLLNSHPIKGITTSSVAARLSQYGRNKIEPPPPTPFWRLLLDPLNDATMIILIIAAVISIVLGSAIHPENMEWIDGVAIFVAVIVVTLVSACNDYAKEK